MQQHFELCVLGSGAVGQTVAYGGRKAGLSVAIVETQAPGGTCPNRGCDAKKPFVNAAGLMYRANHLALAGGGIAPTTLDWAQIAAFKKSFTDPVGRLTTADLKRAGVELIAGGPRFTGPNTLVVDGRTLTADRLVIATGQRPRPLDVPGAGLTLDSDAFLDLDDLPPRVTFIGGGYVGMEFACAAAMAGRQVTVVATQDHVLAGFDPDIVATLEAALPTLGPHGVTVIPNRRAGSFSSTPDGITVHANDAAATALVTADLVVNTTGRVASVDGLDLAAAGITAGPRGVEVDKHLRCPGNPRVWAGGDVADNGRPALIPTAVDDARVLAHNLFQAAGDAELQTRPVDKPQASVAFTLPAVAGVGLTEAQARRQHGPGLHVAQGNFATKKFFRELGQPHVAWKMIFAPDRRLLGAHLAVEGSDEVINLLALSLGQIPEDAALYHATLTYPSVSSAVQTAFRKAAKAV